MALAMKDMVKGTIVDHTYKYDAEERSTDLRPIRRRGIIVKVIGDTTTSVSEIWVKFKADKPAEKVAARELDRFMPWNHKKARIALSRIEGRSESVGGEFEERRAPIRPKAQDALALTPRKQQMLVEPEEDEEDPMLASASEHVPLVVEDTDPE